MIEPFLAAVPVLKKLESAGFEAYFVGGSVRDFLLNKEINDVDIATSATPDEVKKIFSKTVDIGIEHGTVLVLFQGLSYEITTFRSEAEYEDFRRPKEVSFIRNLTEDLQRRDFTMNAIAMDKDGSLVDPFNGQISIKNEVIETVGKAVDRFQEDALRMMRAVRFVSQLSFKIEEKTLNALKDLVHLLENIAVERKQAEFDKLLSGDDRKQALELILETNIYSYLPGLSNQEDKIKLMFDYKLEKLNKREMWALLVYCLNFEKKDKEEFLRGWRIPLKEIREIQLILHYLNQRFETSWSLYDLYTAGKEIFVSSEILYLVINGIEDQNSITHYLQVYEQLPIKERSEMDVTGNDLMEWFNKTGGPWVKELLFKIEQAIIAGKIANNKKIIREWLMECNHN
ncbi:tRNA nucleotidyltransferase (CCA-adding enzyme) [Neobacillus niacini]|jgi:tRNA nucleotidyltransferase (CCA-adding enzyme)|uniref:CCA tRNA nucleotidyltransferase n=1 Tax=Neobacillus niacini TaxID=86668 RepID=UPI002782A146|nr:CCA tRNA nucleotidyltransferase [Neobacillus niacini]MDQ1001742.1 tRNA nucleotidyltransferase (CCA-adding enzyme) [Neobacillus niacini]